MYLVAGREKASSYKLLPTVLFHICTIICATHFIYRVKTAFQIWETCMKINVNINVFL